MALVVGEAASGAEAVRLAEQLQPSLVLMDLQVRGGDGLTAIRQIAAKENVMNSKLFIIGALLFSMALGACGSTRTANFPTGKFIKSGKPNHGLIFNKDGTFSVFEGSSTLVRGRYSVDGDTYTEESNDGGCTDVPKRFKYTFDGTNLTFNYVDNPANDHCGGGGRRADFDNVTYAQSK